MKKGEQAIFYHSNAKPPGVAGICTIVKTAEPDPTQFDPNSNYYDAASKLPARNGRGCWLPVSQAPRSTSPCKGRNVSDDFYLFTNAETSRANVLYRRRAGGIGLIEQE